ncbi:hypothetical protein Ddye_025364 [Dipteronia dyeriana]|uniref:MULE transposase domain-containing protein n=1 Tax=Dipteronia dyeriana TaxID=168575 RepID=A0AAD9TWR6_9ROSI|nr:hypothetical protein Ddye_025364 [Dipteronia dyeriana]
MEDDYLEAYSDNGNESEDFDNDFMEPEYQHEEEPEVVEHNDAFVDNGDEQNEGENDEHNNSGPENDEIQFDDEQKATLNELRKLDRKSSTVVIDTELGANGEHIFRRIYICLNACKVGWLVGCRPIICLDASHNKSQQKIQHKSQLMFAIGIDADYSYYLIAYTVVEKESYCTWKWFLVFLKIDLNLS